MPKRLATLRSYVRDRTVFFHLLAAVTLNACAWGVAWFLLPRGSEEDFFLVPLHFTIYYGIDLIGLWHEALAIPASGTVILLIDWLLALGLYDRERLLSRFFTYAATLAQALVLGAVLLLLVISNP